MNDTARLRARPATGPATRPMARGPAGGPAQLRSALERVSAADAAAGVQQTLGALIGAVALAGLLVFAPGCGVESHRDQKGRDSVFQDQRSDIVRPTRKPEPVDPSSWTWPREGAHRARIEVEGHGAIEIELYPALAPRNVANFEKLASAGYYDGTTFHRVIEGFMVQGGDANTRDANPRNDGRGDPGYSVPDEFSDAPHVRGVVSMANRSAPDTGGSQFFIVQRDHQELDHSYTVIGRVVGGLDVVDAIAAVETDRSGRWGPRDRPTRDVVVSRIRVEGTAGSAATPGAAAAGAPGPSAAHAGSTAADPTGAESTRTATARAGTG